MLLTVISLTFCVCRTRQVLYVSTKSTFIAKISLSLNMTLLSAVPLISLLQSKLFLNSLRTVMKDELDLEHYCSPLIQTILLISSNGDPRLSCIMSVHLVHQNLLINKTHLSLVHLVERKQETGKLVDTRTKVMLADVLVAVAV